MNVFVTGGTGYVGQPLVRQLVSKGHHVKVLTRDPSRADGLPSQVEIVVGDLFDSTALRLGMEEADVVIHLVGIIRENARQDLTMTRVHVDGTVRVMDAAHSSKVRRFLHISALGARPDATTEYHRSKWEAEKRVRQSGLAFTIFRPSIVYGPGGPGPNFLSQLAEVVRKAPVTPVIGQGSFLLQPVHIATVVRVLIQAVDREDAVGDTFEVGGPAIVTYERVVRQIADTLDVHKPTVHIPFPIMQGLVRMFGWIPGFPLTMDQLTMLAEGNVCTNASRLYEVFDIEPIPFEITKTMI